MEAAIGTGAATGPREAVWWQGALFRVPGRRETTNGAFGLVEANFWKGMATPLHIHRDQEEAFYVLEGRMRVRRGSDELTIGPGQLLVVPRGMPHSFKVLDDGTRALVLLVPGGFEEMFLEGGEPVVDQGSPPARQYDIDHVRSLAAKYRMEIVGPPLE